MYDNEKYVRERYSINYLLIIILLFMRRLFNNLCKYKVVLSFNFRDVNL